MGGVEGTADRLAERLSETSASESETVTERAECIGLTDSQTSPERSGRRGPQVHPVGHSFITAALRLVGDHSKKHSGLDRVSDPVQHIAQQGAKLSRGQALG